MNISNDIRAWMDGIKWPRAYQDHKPKRRIMGKEVCHDHPTYKTLPKEKEKKKRRRLHLYPLQDNYMEEKIQKLTSINDTLIRNSTLSFKCSTFANIVCITLGIMPVLFASSL